MKKIISLFQRNYDGDRLVRDEITPGAEWVTAGEGVASRKWDGTCCLIKGGVLFKRYDAKHGKQPPVGFEPAQEPDPVTGHWPGWLQCDRNNPADQWHFEAFCNGEFKDGTFELCGPKIQGNPERFESHRLIRHGSCSPIFVARTFLELKEWFKGRNIEGIVWHHPDGRMVKIKKKDFGLKRDE
jgi:hypothetical protein